MLPAGFLLTCAVGPADPSFSARPGNQDQPNNRADERSIMVARQIRARGVSDPNVLDAMMAVPRHRFVPDDAALQDGAYADIPLLIGQG